MPELLHPAYRELLWSWSPFRFSAEGLRSLLAGTSAPIVGTSVVLFATVAMFGLAVLIWPPHRTSAPAVAAADRVPVPVG